VIKDKLLLSYGAPALLFLVMALSFIARNPFEQSVVGLMALFILPFLLFSKQWPSNYFSQLPVQLLYIFMFYSLLTLLWSPAVEGFRPYVEQLIRVLIVVGFSLVLAYADRRGLDNSKVAEILIILLALFGGLLLSGVFLEDKIKYFVQYRKVITQDGLFRHANSVGWMFAMQIILLIDWFRRSTFSRSICYGLLVTGLLIPIMVMFFAQSRSAYIGLVAGLGMYCLLLNKRVFLVFISLVLLSSLSFVLVYLFMDLPAIESLIKRADAGRFQIYSGAFEAILKKPIWGHGYAASAENVPWKNVSISHYHSLYLNTLFYGGVVALLLLLGIILSTLCCFYKKPEGVVWLSILTLGCVSMLFTGNHVVNYPSAHFYIFVFPILVLAMNGKRAENDQRVEH
jgi:O-antigen ligase